MVDGSALLLFVACFSGDMKPTDRWLPYYKGSDLLDKGLEGLDTKNILRNERIEGVDKNCICNFCPFEG
ncbi:hypothetical protein DRN58_09200 [Thermococci archaeon]|nr:MAG: hypothetical protein DRN58_09200 [Thermococci archaeon]